jgi:hypothetical protein
MTLGFVRGFLVNTELNPRRLSRAIFFSTEAFAFNSFKSFSAATSSDLGAWPFATLCFNPRTFAAPGFLYVPDCVAEQAVWR